MTQRMTQEMTQGFAVNLALFTELNRYLNERYDGITRIFLSLFFSYDTKKRKTSNKE